MKALKYFSLAGALMILAVSIFAAAVPGGGSGGPCVVSYTGGSILNQLPPGCVYQSNGNHVTQGQIPHSIRIRHGNFFGVTTFPGGTLGGHVENFRSDLTVEVGEDVVTVPADVTVSTEPFEDGQSFVSFATSMDRLEGQIEGGPVFDYFAIRGGSELVGESPGQTTFSASDDGETAVVDSVFNIAYEIEFQGAAGGPLEGHGGVYRGTITMEAFGGK